MNLLLEEQPIPSCDGCGVCCRFVASPGYGRFFPADGREVDPEALAGPDHARLLAMPAQLRAELAAYYADPDRPAHGHCWWFDAAAGRCRHHEHRPQVCRDFETGGRDCREIRAFVRLRGYNSDGDNRR